MHHSGHTQEIVEILAYFHTQASYIILIFPQRYIRERLQVPSKIA